MVTRKNRAHNIQQDPEGTSKFITPTKKWRKLSNVYGSIQEQFAEVSALLPPFKQPLTTNNEKGAANRMFSGLI
jgi:hypothetical protein